MLDPEMLAQLREVFAVIEEPITLVYDESAHTNQVELRSMLEDLSASSPKLHLRASGKAGAVPRFWIERAGKPVGIQFRGIPGGHEFTSLVLALLNAAGKGKLPDAGLAARIRNLRGPVRIRTYMSLTCENCPDVVQALNQMALVHPDFHHEVVDGAYAQEEVEALGIQGVPCVFASSPSALPVASPMDSPADSIGGEPQLVHSGRIHFLGLLGKLEAFLGTQGAAIAKEADKYLGHFDVAVLGGGPAGASAAIYSVRKGLKTALLAERMGGQVQDTKGIENLISVISTQGPELAEQLHKHILSYPVSIFEQRRVKLLRSDKHIQLEGGESLSADAIIIATGAKWRELGVPGEKEYLGRGVAYCPHCDGPFYKGKKIAVMGGGNSGVEAAIDLAGIAGEVVLFEYNEALKADKILVDKLESLANTSVVTNARTTELVGDGKKIIAMRYVDRARNQNVELAVDGVFVQIGLLPNSEFARETVAVTKFGEIQVDEKCRTSAKGIYAAGDVTTVPFKQIVVAMGEGAKAGLAAFEDRMYRTAN